MSFFSRTTFITAWAALFIASTAVGESQQPVAQTLVPARLPADFEVSLNEVAFPEYDNVSAFNLNCVTDVSQSGRARHTTCLNDKNFDFTEIRERIAKFMKGIRMAPASVNGETEATEFYFQVDFDDNRKARRIKVHPNWGYNAATYGMQYEAPQRYDTRLFPKGCLFFVGIAATPLDENGHVIGEPKVTTPLLPEDQTLDCIEVFKTRLSDGEYIPAHHEGKPVAAIQLEVWGDPDRYILDLPELD